MQSVIIEANKLLQSGQAEQALVRLTPILSNRPPLDALMLAGMASRTLGQLEAAEGYFARAVQAAPENADIANIHANALAALGHYERAIAAFDRLLAKHPGHIDAHCNRALALIEAGAFADAINACDVLLKRGDDNARILSIRATAKQRMHALESALADMERAIALEPKRAQGHANIGKLYLTMAEAESAVTHLSQAAALGLNTTDLACDWASALLMNGDVTAARTLFEKVLAHQPDHVIASRDLARLLIEFVGDPDPFAHYRKRAEREPTNQSAWGAWLNALTQNSRWVELDTAAAAALRHFADWPEAHLCAATAEGWLRSPANAIQRLRDIMAKMDKPTAYAALPLPFLLMAGDPKAVEPIVREVTAANPYDQTTWAYQATAWRMLDDEREFWLCDYDRFVTPIRVGELSSPPKGQADYARWLAEVLDTLHIGKAEPGDQSLRGGTQTPGALFDRRHPVLKQFRADVLAAARLIQEDWPCDPAHPFLSRRSASMRFTGSWSVRLARGGHHVAHSHANGWISSAFYARLPNLAPDHGPHEGCIQFGAPPDAMGLNLPPRRIVQPEEGLLVLFPSYMWHGTVPFYSGDVRMTAAFDIVPE